MRVSTWPNDPGYTNMERWKGAHVFVDGVLVPKVFTVDTDLGEVICADTDENGNYRVVGDEVATRTVRGKVELVMPYPAAYKHLVK